MWLCTNWVVNWNAISAVGTLLAVLVALGTTAYIEVKQLRRRRIEVRSIASALFAEFKTNRDSLKGVIEAFDRAARLSPGEGSMVSYNLVPLIELNEGVKRIRFSVLKAVADRIALFEEKDAKCLGLLVAATTQFQENQDLTLQDFTEMDTKHAQGTAQTMRGWSQTLVNMLEPAWRRMADIAGFDVEL